MDIKVFWYDHVKSKIPRAKLFIPVTIVVVLFHWMWEKFHFGISRKILEWCGTYERWVNK